MKNQDHELPEECIYVAIDQAVDENAPLPIPTEECKSIGDAVGSHVPWPLHLLKLKDEKPKKKIQEKEKEEKPIDLSNTPAPLRVVYLICKADRQGVIVINIDESLFGQDMCLYVNIEDVKPLCTLEPIAYTCIIVYIWHLHTKICREKKAHKFRFLNPYHVGYIPSTKVDEEQQRKSIVSRTNALAKGLVGTSKSNLVLVPCNVGLKVKSTRFMILTMCELSGQDAYKNIFTSRRCFVGRSMANLNGESVLGMKNPFFVVRMMILINFEL